jgi:transposase-like protein
VNPVAHKIKRSQTQNVSIDYAGWKDRKLVAQALRPIYSAVSEAAALDALQSGITPSAKAGEAFGNVDRARARRNR